MRHRRCIVSGLTTLSVALCLFGPGTGIADPEFVDEQALSNGAQLYAVYCSNCHGTAIEQQPDELATQAVDYSELIEKAQSKASSEANPAPEEDEWPEWAGPRDPNELDEESVPDERAEIANLMTAVIEQVNAPDPELENPGGTLDHNKTGGFEPMLGVTDLSDPQAFYYGTSTDEVFKSIANGTGAAMPGWRTELGSDEAIWDLVHYIRSFWGEEWL